MKGFRTQVFDRSKAAAPEPFPGCDVGGLGIHVDQSVTLFDGDQIVLGLPLGIVGLLTPNLRTHLKKLPASAGIFHMADLRLSMDVNIGNKTVRPVKKPAGNHIFINQSVTSFDLSQDHRLSRWLALAL